jgi:predicted O-methyltransferase YrrM
MSGKTLIHALKCLMGAEDADTQTSEEEQMKLSELAKDKMKVLEIGVFEGHSTRLLAESMSPDGELYGIDPFFKGNLGISYGLWVTRKQVQLAKKTNPRINIKLIRDFSYNAAKDRSLADFDLIFIDGDHSIEGITQDWSDWSDRIVPKGLIALHDTKVPSYNPGVSKLGSFEYFESHIKNDPRFVLVDQVDSMSVLQKV